MTFVMKTKVISLAVTPAPEEARAKVVLPLPRIPGRLLDYTEDVRYYTTKSLNGGTTFKCSYCEHTVTTLDFDSTKGNRRTQAATAINEHAALLHVRPLAPVRLIGRPAL